MAFNLGRPALFAGEETIRNSRDFLNHPLSVRNDSRLVASCELLSARGKQDAKATQPVSDPQPHYINPLPSFPMHRASLTSMRNSCVTIRLQWNGSNIGTSITLRKVLVRETSCGKLVSAW